MKVNVVIVLTLTRKRRRRRRKKRGGGGRGGSECGGRRSGLFIKNTSSIFFHVFAFTKDLVFTKQKTETSIEEVEKGIQK